MTEAVLDASVLIKWFRMAGEPEFAEARALRAAFHDGRLTVTVPSLMYLELINVASRRWGWDPEHVVELARTLRDLEFQQREPDAVTVAQWAARGLTAYDAAYVAVAEAEALPLVTGDRLILDVAANLSMSITAAARAL